MSAREAINPGWNYDRLTYSPAIRTGNTIYLSGFTSVDEFGDLVGRGDIVAQARYIYEKIGKVLAAAGASFDDVVLTREYVTTLEGYREVGHVRREVLKEPFPAATGVVVAGLVREHALIEVEAVAVVDGE
jgi:enamine deaminase RidA (YjgF/YER057c/UK114 family)